MTAAPRRLAPAVDGGERAREPMTLEEAVNVHRLERRLKAACPALAKIYSAHLAALAEGDPGRIARKSGVSRSMIHALMNRERRPTVDTAAALARAIPGLTLEDFVATERSRSTMVD